MPQTQPNPLENGYGIYEDIENPSEGITSGNWLNCVGYWIKSDKKRNR